MARFPDQSIETVLGPVFVHVQGNMFVHAGVEKLKVGRYTYGAHLSRRIVSGSEPSLAPIEETEYVSVHGSGKAPWPTPELRERCQRVLLAATDAALARDPNLVRRACREVWRHQYADVEKRLAGYRTAVENAVRELDRMYYTEPRLLVNDAGVPWGENLLLDAQIRREAAAADEAVTS
jgi:hypothetical protein